MFKTNEEVDIHFIGVDIHCHLKMPSKNKDDNPVNAK